MAVSDSSPGAGEGTPAAGRARRLRGLGLLAFALVGGCGGPSPTMVEVEGTVTLNGKPLPNVIVDFHPMGEPGQPPLPSSHGTTNAQGHYRLTCDNQQAGAVAGRHWAVIRLPLRDRNPDAPPPPPTPVIPLTYLSLFDTPLQPEVKGDQHVYDLRLTSPPPPAGH